KMRSLQNKYRTLSGVSLRCSLSVVEGTGFVRNKRCFGYVLLEARLTSPFLGIWRSEPGSSLYMPLLSGNAKTISYKYDTVICMNQIFSDLQLHRHGNINRLTARVYNNNHCSGMSVDGFLKNLMYRRYGTNFRFECSL